MRTEIYANYVIIVGIMEPWNGGSKGLLRTIGICNPHSRLIKVLSGGKLKSFSGRGSRRKDLMVLLWAGEEVGCQTGDFQV